MLKILSRFRLEKNIGNQHEEEDVNGNLLHRIEGTDEDVECNPGHRQPSRPILALKDKYSSHNCHNLGEQDQEIVAVKPMPGNDGLEMVSKANRAYRDIQPCEQGDR